MGCKTQKFFFEASKIRWGREHCRKVTTVADNADSLDGTYFDLNGTDAQFNEHQYYVWYSTGTATDPSITGKIGIEVTINTGDTAEVVATATKTAIDGITEANRFRTSVDGDVVTIGNRFGGGITAETDSGSTGFTFEVDVEGSGLDLGKTQDGIELSLEVSTGDVTTNQTGELLKAQIYQGSSASVSANFIELTNEVKKELVAKVTGDSASAESTGEVIGYGESRLFEDLQTLGGQLVVHPLRLADSDYTRDLVFWNSAPKPESLNFDGTAVQQMSTTFDAYLDERYSEKIRLLALGGLGGADWTSKDLDA